MCERMRGRGRATDMQGGAYRARASMVAMCREIAIERSQELLFIYR